MLTKIENFKTTITRDEKELSKGKWILPFRGSELRTNELRIATLLPQNLNMNSEPRESELRTSRNLELES